MLSAVGGFPPCRHCPRAVRDFDTHAGRPPMSRSVITEPACATAFVTTSVKAKPPRTLREPPIRHSQTQQRREVFGLVSRREHQGDIPGIGIREMFQRHDLRSTLVGRIRTVISQGGNRNLPSCAAGWGAKMVSQVLPGAPGNDVQLKMMSMCTCTSWRPGSKQATHPSRQGHAAGRYDAGSTVPPLIRTSKCRWGPVESPVDPSAPSTCPGPTCCPTVTSMTARWA